MDQEKQNAQLNAHSHDRVGDNLHATNAFVHHLNLVYSLTEFAATATLRLIQVQKMR